MSENEIKKVKTKEGELFWIRMKTRKGQKKWRWYGEVFSASGVVQFLSSKGVSIPPKKDNGEGVYEFEATQYLYQVECIPVIRAVDLNEEQDEFRMDLLSRAKKYSKKYMSSRVESAYMEGEEYAEEEDWTDGQW